MKNLPANKGIANAAAPARGGFTLIELLTVIAIIGVLAGLFLTVAGSVTKNKYISNAQAELASIQSAIEAYHAAYGVYPPSAPGNTLVNPLFLELSGTTNVIVSGGNTNCTTLDGQQAIPLASVYSAYGVRGFINCTRGNGEDMVAAKTFLPNLKANQVGTNSGGAPILLSSVGGPDQAYQPLGITGVNPWRYNSANPTNNPGTYDLYIQLTISRKTYLVCNWNKQVQKNPSYP